MPPLTARHKECLTRFETRTKELNDFIAERGDNITAADLAKASTIRDDIRGIKGEIETCKEFAGLATEGESFRAYMEDPATGHRHPANVLGSTRAGSTTFEHRIGSKGSRSYRKALKVLKERGAGVLGVSGGYAANASQVIATREYREGMRAYFRRGENAAKLQCRNFEEGLDPQGGFLAPTEVIAKLIERKPSPTRVSGLVSVINSNRDAILVPRVNYTGATDDPNATLYSTGIRATLTDENPISDDQAQVNDTNIFGVARVDVFTYLLEGVLTMNQIEDGMFDPLAWLARTMGTTTELLKDNMLINGSGVGQPSGMLSLPGGSDVNSFPPTVTSGSAASPYLTPDGLINLSEDIPEQYDDNIRYLFKKTSTGKVIRTMKDSNNRYLFGRGYDDSGITNPRAKEINGYPVIYSQFMPDPAAAPSYPVIAGDFEAVTLVNRIGISIQILREVAARRNQVIVLGRIRFGCQVLEPWRLRVQSVPSS